MQAALLDRLSPAMVELDEEPRCDRPTAVRYVTRLLKLRNYTQPASQTASTEPSHESPPPLPFPSLPHHPENYLASYSLFAGSNPSRFSSVTTFLIRTIRGAVLACCGLVASNCASLFCATFASRRRGSRLVVCSFQERSLFRFFAPNPQLDRTECTMRGGARITTSTSSPPKLHHITDMLWARTNEQHNQSTRFQGSPILNPEYRVQNAQSHPGHPSKLQDPPPELAARVLTNIARVLTDITRELSRLTVFEQRLQMQIRFMGSFMRGMDFFSQKQ